MRLVRLNDMLAAGRPLHAVMRDGSGAGTLLHWSHLLDGLLLLLAAPLASWLGWHTALHVAGVVSGPFSLAALGAAVAWTVSPLSTPGWLWLGAFAAGAAPNLRGYGLLGEVSHHVLLVVTVVMAGGWALRLLRGAAQPARAGAAIAAWTAAGLWLSPETVPYSLMVIGAVWAAWFVRPSAALRRALIAHAALLLVLVCLIVLVDPPAAGWLAGQPDRISLPFAALAAGALITALAAQGGRRWPPLVCGSLSGALWLVAFPEVLHGTAGLMTPAQAEAFFPGIIEMAPVGSFEDAVDCLAAGLLSAGVLAAWAWRVRATAAAGVLAYAALCTLAGLGAAALHVRFAAYLQAEGAILLPALLTMLSAAEMPPVLRSVLRLALILLLIGAPALLAVAPGGGGTATAGAAVCGIDGAARLLAAHPGAVVLAEPNATPDLLYRTRVLTVGSLYHRNIEGFMRLRAAWRSVPGGTPGDALRSTRATLVLGCPGAARSVLVKGLPETTLLDRLTAAAPPPWLRRIGDAGPGGYVLYEVDNK